MNQISISSISNSIISTFQREKDDAVCELDALKDKFEMTNSTQNRVVEEKELLAKELDRLLEKYDR